MKILFCTNTYTTTDTGPAVFAQKINELDSVRVLTEDISAQTSDVYKLNVFLTWIPIFSQWIRRYLYYKRIQKIYKSYSFDVVIFNQAYLGLTTQRRFNKAKVVGMINDDNCMQSQSILRRKLGYAVYRIWERKSARLFDSIIVNSDYLKQKVSGEYSVDSNRIKVLRKGVTFDVSDRIKNMIGSSVNLLFVKTDYQRGGLSLLIEAIGLLSQYKFVLTIVGPLKISSSILKQASRHSNLKLNIRSYVNHENIRSHLLTSDLFCVPSIHEALGVANLEALSQNVPVLAYATGGVKEVLSDGTAWLFIKYTPAALAFAMGDCIKNESERRMKSKMGIEVIKKNYTYDRVTREFEAFFY